MCTVAESKNVTVVGLGRIGLVTALLLKRQGHRVIGVDTDKARLRAIALKSLHLEEPEIRTLFESTVLELSEEPHPAEVVLICVPTPLTPEMTADLTMVEAAVGAVAPHMDRGSLILIESTCPIGTTDRLSRTYPEVLFAHCPERVLPGRQLEELTCCDRIIGGVCDKATQLAADFYRTFVTGQLHMTTARMAEAVKLCENAFRDVNLAFSNELSMIADEEGLCIQSLISLANCHPRVSILQPGCGVGGHCIPVDPHFLIQAHPESASLMREARKINGKKTQWVLEKIRKKIERHQCRKIALCGLSYKANVADFRQSPALAIFKELSRDHEVVPVDPYLSSTMALEEAVEVSDLVVGLVPHREFLQISRSQLEEKIVCDFAEVFS